MGNTVGSKFFFNTARDCWIFCETCPVETDLFIRKEWELSYSFNFNDDSDGWHPVNLGEGIVHALSNEWINMVVSSCREQ